MKAARVTAILALREANKALMLAHGALVELGDSEKSEELVEMASDLFEMTTEVTRDRVNDYTPAANDAAVKAVAS